MSAWDILDLYLRRWKRYDTHQLYGFFYSRRRILLTLVALCIVFLYIGPFFVRLIWRRTPIPQGKAPPCLKSSISQYLAEERHFEASVWDDEYYNVEHEVNHKHFFSYIGNGKFGLPLEESCVSKPFYILGKRSLDTVLPYYPLVELDIDPTNLRKTTAVRYISGLVNRITCIPFAAQSVSVHETIYAHRLISSLLIQEIDIINPTDVPLKLNMMRGGWRGSSQLASQTLPLRNQKDSIDYVQMSGELESKEDRKNSIGFTIITQDVPATIEVRPQSKRTLIYRTFLNYTKPTPKTKILRFMPGLKHSLSQTVDKVVEISGLKLYNHHVNAWSKLWSSGFGISYSKAHDSLNGDIINATIYYLLSQKSALPVDIEGVELTADNFLNMPNKLLDQPDNCYNGHSTLQASALWSNLDSINDINRIVSHWLLTLEKQGCHNLIESGAEGTLQAFILSLCAIEFTKNHLEFNTHPKDLHRDYFIRRLRYGNSTLLNVTISLDEENKASIYVAIDQNSASRKFYACDGGCIDTPVSLSQIWSQFSVKLTQPITAILYITPDREHIKELKHSIHFKEISEAPAHEHQIIALHRHGHQLGGLPALFWLSIVFLIVIFHLFLAKLIYNEYCGGSTTRYEKVRSHI